MPTAVAATKSHISRCSLSMNAVPRYTSESHWTTAHTPAVAIVATTSSTANQWVIFTGVNAWSSTATMSASAATEKYVPIREVNTIVASARPSRGSAASTSTSHGSIALASR
jgi:hypothetical protein